MSEHGKQKEVQNALARPDCRTFRANVGKGWTSSQPPYRVPRLMKLELQPGDIVLRAGRPFSTGLPTGFSDLFGGVQHTVTAEDVGKTFARLFLLEMKAEDGKLTKEQQAFINAMQKFGALAGVVRSVDDALRILFSSE